MRFGYEKGMNKILHQHLSKSEYTSDQKFFADVVDLSLTRICRFRVCAADNEKICIALDCHSI
jgi:hypothetical protein